MQLLLLLIWGASSAAEARPQATPHSHMQAVTDVAYGSHERQRLDLIFPLSAPRPLVVFLHGGAWRDGDKNPNRAEFLVRAGFAVASVNFRTSRQVTFPGPLQDCQAAIAFLRSNATRYNLDARRIGVWGESSGGHLASLLGTTGNQHLGSKALRDEQGADVQAVFSQAGPGDLALFGNSLPGDALTQLFGRPTAEIPGLVRAADPAIYADAADPPLFLVHGARDEIVPVEHAMAHKEAILRRGGRCDLEVLPEGGHDLDNGYWSRVSSLAQDFFLRSLKP